jgi:hypothetical protein
MAGVSGEGLLEEITRPGEYWTVITGDGTKYVFGLNKLEGAGTNDRTKSVPRRALCARQPARVRCRCASSCRAHARRRLPLGLHVLSMRLWLS